MEKYIAIRSIYTMENNIYLYSFCQSILLLKDIYRITFELTLAESSSELFG